MNIPEQYLETTILVNIRISDRSRCDDPNNLLIKSISDVFPDNTTPTWFLKF